MNPKQNELLAAVPAETLERWLPFLELVDLELGSVLSESGAMTDHVYFPVSGIVSLIYVMENGNEAEFAIVGLEGLLGISAFMGGDSTSSVTMVKCSGRAFRLSSQQFRMEFAHTPVMHLFFALHASTFDPDHPDRCVQPAPHAAPATVAHFVA